MADAPVSEIVSLSITQDNVVIQRANYGTPLILSPNAAWAERARAYSGIADVAADWAATTPEYLAANAIFSQNPCPDLIYIGRAVGKPTLAYRLDVTSVATGSNYAVTVTGTGVTTTSFSYVPKADVTGTFLPRTTNVLTLTAHGMITGEGPYRVSSSGALPTGLTADTNYWIIAVTADTFSFASSKANALAATPVALSGDGSGTQTLRRTENDVICAQIVQGLNAVVGANYVAAQVTGAGETDYVTATANIAGGYFAIQTPAALIKSVMTHATTSPTVATDLTAINAEQPNWYVLYTLYNSDAYAKDAAAWVESNGKIYIADLVASESATLASGGSDTMQALASLNYKRTAVLWHPLPSEMNGAAWMGDRLTDDPGGNTWKFSKQFAGVDPVDTTGTWRTNIRAKHGNVYIKTSGLAIMVEGTMCDGGFIDTRRGLDFLQDDASKSVYEVIAAARKVPFTDAGIAIVVSALRASLKRCFGMGIINADFAITFPKARDVSSTNRGLRILPDIKFSCTLQGAIHKVIIAGVVSV